MSGASNSSRCGLEHRPADLGSMLALIRRLERADEVVLANRPLHTDRPFGDHRTERGVSAIEVLDRPVMHGDRILHGGKLERLDTTVCLEGPGDGNERHDLAVLV